ncbi:2Fe-2S iron-sulfur cluster-binding protein [Streptomyces sp. NPDC057428]|uniref:2Fe-2S iron-sulfur cluster-binding protein n=1 Tax=Streptomyces sp. NPDC057428 TaxID=3346129 RepID=UPI003684D5ED
MSNEENPGQRHVQPDPYAGWEPTPQGGEYDAEATAFVHLPPEDFADLGGDPLAAPGHSYVPPMILPLTPAAGLDPAVTGSWVLQTQGQQERAAEHAGPEAAPDAVRWPDPNQQQEQYQQPYPDTSQYAQTSSTTAHWNFNEAAHPAEPEPEPSPEPAGHTGQWTVPVAGGDIPEESGEFAASAMAQWYADSPPVTLPGGARAPWATQEPVVPEPSEPATVAEEGPGAPQEAAETPQEAAETGQTPEGAEGAHPAPDAPSEAPETPGEPEEVADTAGTPETPETEDAPDTEAERVPEPEHALEHALEDPLVPADEPAAAAMDAPSEHASASYVLHVNGADRPVADAWIGESLLYVLRERLGLAGAKDGCSQGECGACNVQVDGRLVASCLVPAATTAGSEVRTVEGLAVDGEPSDVQRALAKCGAVQCGFCIPGMAMTVHDLLEGNHAPSELETRQALCGNLCRCSGYRGVLDAVREVVAGREAVSEPATGTLDDLEPRIPHQAAPGEGGVQHEGDVR